MQSCSLAVAIPATDLTESAGPVRVGLNEKVLQLCSK
jgi:hypothetical protein